MGNESNQNPYDGDFTKAAARPRPNSSVFKDITNTKPKFSPASPEKTTDSSQIKQEPSINTTPKKNLFPTQDNPSQYLTEQERKKIAIYWSKDATNKKAWRYESNGKPISSGVFLYHASAENNDSWEHWITSDNKVSFHSQIAGANPADPEKAIAENRKNRSSGHMFIVDGLVRVVTNGSGHFKPTIRQMFDFLLRVFKLQGCKDGQINFQAFFKNQQNDNVEALIVPITRALFTNKEGPLKSPNEHCPYNTRLIY